MPIIGHNFFKIEAKNKKVEGKVKIDSINNNIKITSVGKRRIKPRELGNAIAFSYEFTTDYELEKPKDKELGNILIEGEILWKGKADEIMRKWRNEKKIKKGVFKKVLNAALSKSQIKVLELSQDLNLPVPVNLPKITKKQKKVDKEERLSYIR